MKSVLDGRRKRKKVAIVGGGPTGPRAPLDDASWEIWTFGRSKKPLPRFDRWFEMHSVPQLKALRGDRRTKMRYPELWRFLRRLHCPVYMQKRHEDIPMSVAYPLERALKEFGRCFTSTVSYMIALAIMEGYSHIGLWGVDLTDLEEYVHQRDGIEYLLGVAASRGIAVTLPRSCTLTVPLHPVPVHSSVLYGYDWDHPDAWWNQRKREKKREKKASKKKHKANGGKSTKRKRTKRTRKGARRKALRRQSAAQKTSPRATTKREDAERAGAERVRARRQRARRARAKGATRKGITPTASRANARHAKTRDAAKAQTTTHRVRLPKVKKR